MDYYGIQFRRREFIGFYGLWHYLRRMIEIYCSRRRLHDRWLTAVCRAVRRAGTY